MRFTSHGDPALPSLTLLPKELVGFRLGLAFCSRFRHTFMYQHSRNAPNEMRQLHEQFYGCIKSK